jgi:hypothetical protein
MGGVTIISSKKEGDLLLLGFSAFPSYVVFVFLLADARPFLLVFLAI